MTQGDVLIAAAASLPAPSLALFFVKRWINGVDAKFGKLFAAVDQLREDVAYLKGRMKAGA